MNRVWMVGMFYAAPRESSQNKREGLRSVSGPQPGEGRQGAECAAAIKARFTSLYLLALSTNAAPKVNVPGLSQRNTKSVNMNCSKSLGVSKRRSIISTL